MKVLAELEIEESVFWQMVSRSVPRVSTQRLPEQPEPRVQPEDSPNDRWMRVNEGAKYASVSRTLMYEACASGRLRHARVGEGGTIRLRKAWIDEWMTRSGTHAAGE